MLQRNYLLIALLLKLLQQNKDHQWIQHVDISLLGVLDILLLWLVTLFRRYERAHVAVTLLCKILLLLKWGLEQISLCAHAAVSKRNAIDPMIPLDLTLRAAMD